MQPQRSSKEGKFLCKQSPVGQKLEGKTFYLDIGKQQQAAPLLDVILDLGGRVDGFLHKGVHFVVTDSKEGLKEEKPASTKGGSEEKTEGTQQLSKLQESGHNSRKQQPMVYGSRGKVLLEKAIQNNALLQTRNALATARIWGAKILSVDEAFSYLKRLKLESSCVKQSHSTAEALKLPFLKIEDRSRKYKPLYEVFEASAALSPLEKESLPSWYDKVVAQLNATKRKKAAESVSPDKFPKLNVYSRLLQKSKISYCECCLQVFTGLDEHLQSEKHRAFARDSSNYSQVDKIVAEMHPYFDLNVFQQSDETLIKQQSPLPLPNVSELEIETDAEAEFAVQALCAQSSSFTRAITNTDSLEVQFSSSRTPSTGQIQLFRSEMDCRTPDNQLCALSPTMPVLNIEPQAGDSLHPQRETKDSSPYPSVPFPSSKPHSSPPNLSPLYIMEPHSPFSELPILSPHPAEDGPSCEMDTSQIMSRFLTAVAERLRDSLNMSETNVEGEETHREGSNELRPSKSEGSLLPPCEFLGPNLKKRCQAACCEHGCIKKRKMAACGHCASRMEEMLDGEMHHDDCMVEVGDQITEQITHPGVTSDVNTQQTCTTSLTGPDSPREHNQIDTIAYHLTSKATLTDSALDFAKYSTEGAFKQQSASVCIEDALIPDPGVLAPSASSDSDWDCGLMSKMSLTSAGSPTLAPQNSEVHNELLQRTCKWMNDSSYESRLHSILQQTTKGVPSSAEEKAPL